MKSTFRKYGCDATMMMPLIEKHFFKKFLVNSNPYVKFGVFITFGLEVTVDREAFLPRSLCKMR